MIEAIAPGLEKLGVAFIAISEKLDNRWVQYGLTAIDIASGPIKFAITEAIMASPLGDSIGTGIQAHSSMQLILLLRTPASIKSGQARWCSGQLRLRGWLSWGGNS